ncbi:23S rRNA (adenine(2030)-N(6))-methyltransferase RlmJ [Isoalcanivorax beigongshangi]|uniref:Ribosomal RNA large subunit methyltransferase J n=1 Tax=Isoalcanivorax beigongshangi TaxID=3238810 RepID=A0ABV4AHE8_9GAMM
MLSYQHGYHAGNAADLHKHAILTLVLQYLRRKPKPFTALDVYAGRGLYDLSGHIAQKTKEADAGILRAWEQSWPAALGDYRQVLRHCNPHREHLQFYPGSPTILDQLLPADSPLQLCELHPQEHNALEKLFERKPRVHIHRRDALEALGGLLPPTPRRGLVLIDPSYEQGQDYRRVGEAVLQAHQRWPQGVILLWYPLLGDERHLPMLRNLVASSMPMLQCEWAYRPRGAGMHGSGMLVVNPPYLLAEQLNGLSAWFGSLVQAGSPSLLIRPHNLS